MSRYGKGTFGSGLEINAQVVNGKCPSCNMNGIFVSIHKTVFRCITCGSDLEQKVNGKIQARESGLRVPAHRADRECGMV